MYIKRNLDLSLDNSVMDYSIIHLDEQGFYHPRSKPTKSLLKAVKLFNEKKGKIIIEIGSGIQGEMSGNSVIIWAEHSKAERIIAIDLDPEQIKTVCSHTKAWANVEAFVADGIEYLKTFHDKIDLLYLDFWVVDNDNRVPGTARAEAYRSAYQAAKNKLSEVSIILIDDTDHIHPWKHTYIVPEARADGFKVLYTGRQTLLVRNGDLLL